MDFSKLFIHIHVFFLQIINFIKKLYKKNDEQNKNSVEPSLLTKNEIIKKERWKVFIMMNKIFIYPKYNSSDSLKTITCNQCSKNITTSNVHCFNDNIYCHGCYYTIPFVKKIIYK